MQSSGMASATESAYHKEASHRDYEGHPVVYAILKITISLLMRLVYRYKVTRLAPFPQSGPVIVVVNHLHLLDPGVIAPVVPRRVVTFAADKWRRKPLSRWFLNSAGVIFVKRGEVDRKALRACLNVLRDGGVLAVAPEGTRSEYSGLQPAKAGVAYLAAHTRAQIVPIAHTGVEKLAEWKRLKRPTCSVVVGEPFRLPEVESGDLDSEKLREFTDLIMVRLGLLLPEEYRGVYKEQIAAMESREMQS
ncbi:MAG: lysophospholipid acyltransferase family protein [Chloroflexota bacterium]|nr:lysophospholipid acyltransferase family protein [Chloroflexota bacterium]